VSSGRPHSPAGLLRKHRALLAITAGAAALRWAGIGDKPLWLDEVLAFEWSRLPAGELWHGLGRAGAHPPLYFLLLRGFGFLFGEGEAGLRAMSAVASTATVPVLDRIVEPIAGRAAGLTAAALLAVSPWHVCYAQEARMYALLTLLLALALWAVVQLLAPGAEPRSDDATTRRAAESGPAASRTHPALLALFTATALWTHAFALLFLVAVAVAAFVIAARGVGGERLRARRVVVSLAVAGLLWSPWWLVWASQARRVYGDFWIPPTSWRSLLDIWRSSTAAFTSMADSGASSLALSSGSYLELRLLFDAAFALGVLLGIRALWRQKRALGLLLAVWLLPIVVVVTASSARPLLLDRTLIWTSLPVLGLVAVGVARSRPAVRAIVLPILGLASLVGLHNYHAGFRKEAWDEAAELVTTAATRDDVVLFHANFVQIPFDYYRRRHAVTLRERGLPVDARFGHSRRSTLTDEDLADLPSWIVGVERVWLVAGYVPSTERLERLLSALTNGSSEVDRNIFHGVEVYSFRYPSAADPNDRQPANRTPAQAGGSAEALQSTEPLVEPGAVGREIALAPDGDAGDALGRAVEERADVVASGPPAAAAAEQDVVGSGTLEGGLVGVDGERPVELEELPHVLVGESENPIQDLDLALDAVDGVVKAAVGVGDLAVDAVGAVRFANQRLGDAADLRGVEKEVVVEDEKVAGRQVAGKRQPHQRAAVVLAVDRAQARVAQGEPVGEPLVGIVVADDEPLDERTAQNAPGDRSDVLGPAEAQDDGGETLRTRQPLHGAEARSPLPGEVAAGEAPTAVGQVEVATAGERLDEPPAERQATDRRAQSGHSADRRDDVVVFPEGRTMRIGGMKEDEALDRGAVGRLVERADHPMTLARQEGDVAGAQVRLEGAGDGALLVVVVDGVGRHFAPPPVVGLAESGRQIVTGALADQAGVEVGQRGIDRAREVAVEGPVERLFRAEEAAAVAAEQEVADLHRLVEQKDVGVDVELGGRRVDPTDRPPLAPRALDTVEPGSGDGGLADLGGYPEPAAHRRRIVGEDQVADARAEVAPERADAVAQHRANLFVVAPDRPAQDRLSRHGACSRAGGGRCAA
jgi:4-amino-4-deoxy-L-arabinose transferase-like glycosyltransferase